MNLKKSTGYTHFKCYVVASHSNLQLLLSYDVLLWPVGVIFPVVYKLLSVLFWELRPRSTVEKPCFPNMCLVSVVNVLDDLTLLYNSLKLFHNQGADPHYSETRRRPSHMPTDGKRLSIV